MASCSETSVKAGTQNNLTQDKHLSPPGHAQPTLCSVGHVHHFMSAGWARQDSSLQVRTKTRYLLRPSRMAGSAAGTKVRS